MASHDPFGRGRVRRLFGLDRSAPPPPSTRKGEPLNPWTIPNAVGYLRLAALPVFLVLAYGTEDGTSLASAMVFWAIAAGDYLDGILARITGQYSRMGALLDPLVDRLTILAGAVVCWSFELLPRWALALLALRELAMLSPSTGCATASTSRSTGRAGSPSFRSWAGSSSPSSLPDGLPAHC
jgi:cardiolipin synthase